MAATLDELQQAAKRIAVKYDELNRSAGRELWSASDFMAGFVGDVGDLSKLIMMQSGRRRSDAEIDKKLAHELSDCLWSILILAGRLQIDLETAFSTTMQELEEQFTKGNA